MHSSFPTKKRFWPASNVWIKKFQNQKKPIEWRTPIIQWLQFFYFQSNLQIMAFTTKRVGTIFSKSHLHITHKRKFCKIWYDLFQPSMHIDLYSLTLCLVLWCAVYSFPPCPALALRDLISKSFTGWFINQLRTTKFHHRYSH